MVQMSKEIMMKFINNTCSDEELQMIKSWLDESDENVKELFELEQTAMYAGSLRDDTDSRRRVSAEIKRRIIGREAGRRARSRSVMLRWMSAAAAIVVIAVTSVFLFRGPDVKMLKAVALNESCSVVLPDGSTVYLSRGSELEYPEDFSSDRKVSLSGEGFFKVTHDAEHPFIVEGEFLNVKVLGTEFNFNSNKDGQNNCSLVEGSVEVSTADNSHGVVLTPGQKADYDIATGNITVSETNAPVDAAWHNKVIPFDNATIKDIVEILVKLYKVDIKLDKNVDLSTTYSGATVFYDSIDSTLTQLTNTLPIGYTKAGTSIMIKPKVDKK